MNSVLVRGDWWFDHARAGTMQTSGLRSLLEGAHLTPAELLIREVTQNSVDARAEGGPVIINITSFTASAGQMKALEAFLVDRTEFSDRVPQFLGNDGFSKTGSIFSQDLPNQPIKSLLVEDYGTIGLGGAIGGEGPEDHFSRLVYFFGQSHGKGATGGAFGFGKSVYSVASKARTVVYYSKPAGNKESRIIAVSLFPGHEKNGKRFTGYALCGRRIDDDAFPITPIVGAGADSLAEAIGMKKRGTNEFGTSLLIVDCGYEIRDLRSALEKWWWPRLVTTGPDGLVVGLREENSWVSPPDPASRRELIPYVRAFEHHLDGRGDTDDTRSRLIRSTGQRIVGKMTLKKIEVDEGLADQDQWFSHTVALLRGPRLVVEYAPFGHKHMPAFAGVFVADDAMDPVLREAENPAHDTWAPESGRLKDSERAFVRAITKYGRKFAREFQSSFIAKPIARTAQFHELETLLGRAFKKGGNVGPVASGHERPISLSVRESRDSVAGFDEAQIVIRSKIPEGEMLAVIEVTAHILGDARRSRVDGLDVELMDENGVLLTSGRKAKYDIKIPPDIPIRFTGRTAIRENTAVEFEVQVIGRLP